MKSSAMRLIIPFIAFATGLGLYSCEKDQSLKIPLNIDYPAAYVVNGTDGTLSVIRLSDYVTTAIIDLNGASYPHHVYMHPQKTKLAIAITGVDLSGGHGGHGGSGGQGGSPEDYKVLIVDAVTGNIEREIQLDEMPHNAIFNGDGSELWVGQSHTEQSHVLVFNTTDWTIKNTIQVGAGLSEVTFAPDGKTVFACNTDDGTVTVIDAVEKTVLATIEVGEDPVGAWVGGNGFMYVDNETSETISEISIEDKQVTSTITLVFRPGYVSVVNDELWVSDSENGGVAYYLLNSGTWILEGRINTSADSHAIAYSNGKAFITNQGANTVSVVDVATHKVIATIQVGLKPNGIVIRE